MAITGISTQIMIGKTEEETFSRKEIETRIRKAQDLLGIKRLLFWNAGEESNFDLVLDICLQTGMEAYCWFPVAADLMNREVMAAESIENITGTRGYGRAGRWPKLGRGEEKFLFACPSHGEIHDENSALLGRLLDKHPFTGVFLDRIRYPSFADGLESLFGCLCPDCRRAYEDDNFKISWEELRLRQEEMFHFFRNAAAVDWAPLTQWQKLFEAFGLSDFYEFRYRRIERLTGIYTTEARIRGRKVGLDLLSPSLSPMTGQDYPRLSRHSDWIKVMSYCYANGPAGIPLEAGSLLRGLKALNPALSDAEAAAITGSFFQTSITGTPEKLLRNGVPAEYLKQEVNRAAVGMPDRQDQLIPGIEVVNHPFFTPPVKKNQLTAYLDVLDSMDCETVICWNILYIPEEYQMMIKQRMNP